MTDYYRLETELGAFLMWRNSSTHVGLRTENQHGRYGHNAPRGGWDGVLDSVTFGTSAYNVHDHVTITGPGSFEHYDDGLSRPLTSDRWRDKPAPTHIAKLRKITEPAIEAWLDTAEGKRAGFLADVERAKRDRSTAQVELVELDAKRAELETARLEAHDRLTAARAALEGVDDTRE